MNKIQELPEKLINKIAAGEVIDKPASVVKELVENSIDAKSTEIIIKIEEGGKKSIEIIDNGIGMDEDDIQLCFKLHTTSKLTTLEDLNNIFTLGFRGEALSSICSVSEVSIHSKNTTDNPTRIIVENSELIKTDHPARKQGTTIKVQDIFRHLPARKKFLKTDNTEYRHILVEINKFAIIYPQISFKLFHNEKEVLSVRKTESQKQRICELYKNISDENLIETNFDGPRFKLNGFIIHPNQLSRDRGKQFLYLNNRSIQERSLFKAIKDGYSSLIPPDRQPGFFINITIDPQEIDVNIHPRKLEVKISNINEVYSALKRTIDSSLTNMSQSELRNKIDSFKKDYASNSQNQTSTEYTHAKTFNPPKVEERPTFTSPKAQTGFKYNLNQLKPKKTAINESISFTESLLASTETASSFKYFQVFDTYIFLQKDNQLQIIDQHAADERINYERILKKIEEGELIQRKDLLIPIEVDLSLEEISLIEPYLEELSKLGIDIDIFSETSIKINSLPEFAREVKHKDLLIEVIETIREEGKGDFAKTKHKLAASLACHGSIRAGKKLSEIEISKIIEDLFKCDKPYSCPHGRPIIWSLPRYEIEKQFERVK